MSKCEETGANLEINSAIIVIINNPEELVHEKLAVSVRVDFFLVKLSDFFLVQDSAGTVLFKISGRMFAITPYIFIDPQLT